MHWILEHTHDGQTATAHEGTIEQLALFVLDRLGLETSEEFEHVADEGTPEAYAAWIMSAGSALNLQPRKIS